MLESESLEQRLFKALLLLKKEKELSQLQQDINKEVCVSWRHGLVPTACSRRRWEGGAKAMCLSMGRGPGKVRVFSGVWLPWRTPCLPG